MEKPSRSHTHNGGVLACRASSEKMMIYAFWDLKNYLEKPLLLPSSWSCKNWGPFCLNVVSLCCEQELGLWPSRKQGGEVLHTSRQTTRGIFCVYQTKIREGGGLKPTVVYRPYFFTNFSRSWISRAARYWSQLPASICTSIFAASATLVNQQNQKVWTQEANEEISKYEYSHILPFILNSKNKKANKQKGCLSVCTPAYIHVTLVQSLSEVLHYEFPGKQMDHTWSCVHQHLYPLTTYHMDTLLNLLSRGKKGSNPH